MLEMRLPERLLPPNTVGLLSDKVPRSKRSFYYDVTSASLNKPVTCREPAEFDDAGLRDCEAGQAAAQMAANCPADGQRYQVKGCSIMVCLCQGLVPHSINLLNTGVMLHNPLIVLLTQYFSCGQYLT